MPLPSVPTSGVEDGKRRNRGQNMAALIEEERLDADGQPAKRHHSRRQPKRKLKSKRTKITADNVEDEDDGDFSASDSNHTSSLSPESGDSEMEVTVIPNDEIADLLPSKTAPKTKRTKSTTHTKKKSRAATVEEVEDDDAPRNPPTQSSVASSQPGQPTTEGASNPTTHPKKATGVKRNPVYLFYEVVSQNASGMAGDPGDKHYKCYHGNRKVLTVTRAMKSSLNGLINHLKSHFPGMFRLYCILKDRAEPPTAEEIAVASGKQALDPTSEAEYIKKLEAANENIRKAFAAQAAQAAGPWDQEKFERLLTEWIVACDQPFDEVEKPEFVNLMTYAHHPASSVKLPSREGVRRRVMKMGDNTVEGIREMFSGLEGKVALSLDAWTSSNQHAFLVIVAHYITNEGQLEELLIDFRELVGKHSGENMAEAVWETLAQYGLIGRIIVFVMDNATNNDTMVVAIEQRCREVGVYFSAKESRMRCMPHTVHLAAIKLLEGIGALSKADSKKALSRSGNYQDSAMAPLGREHDNEAVQLEDEDDSDDNNDNNDNDASENPAMFISAITKLRKIVRNVRSSPQRRQKWCKEIYIAMNQGGGNDKDQSPALMLILDVRTRWSSTHQMLHETQMYSITVT